MRVLWLSLTALSMGSDCINDIAILMCQSGRDKEASATQNVSEFTQMPLYLCGLPWREVVSVLSQRTLTIYRTEQQMRCHAILGTQAHGS